MPPSPPWRFLATRPLADIDGGRARRSQNRSGDDSRPRRDFPHRCLEPHLARCLRRGRHPLGSTLDGPVRTDSNRRRKWRRRSSKNRAGTSVRRARPLASNPPGDEALRGPVPRREREASRRRLATSKARARPRAAASSSLGGGSALARSLPRRAPPRASACSWGQVPGRSEPADHRAGAGSHASASGRAGDCESTTPPRGLVAPDRRPTCPHRSPRAADECRPAASDRFQTSILRVARTGRAHCPASSSPRDSHRTACFRSRTGANCAACRTGLDRRLLVGC